MKIELMLNDETIEHIIKYFKQHPEVTKALIKNLGDEVFKVFTSPRVLRKCAGLYKDLNREINRDYKVEEVDR